MRNLKKSLALVLVFAMAMATVAGAAFADVPADHAFNEEIEALTGLDILQGMGNDNFAPDGTLTRAQAAAVIYRSLTGRSSADVHQTATAFSDVAGNFWGAGYINYCSDLGVINGYPDGTFKPDSPVTYAEFTKMIVVALGADAGKNLVYPTGYIATAEMYKVLEDISFVPGAPAKRADIAKIAYNAIFEAPYARKMIPGTVYEAGKEPKIAVDVLQLGKSKVTITGIGKNYGDTSDKEDEVKLANIEAKGYDKFPNGKAIYTGKLDPSQLGLSAIVYWKVINGDTKAYSITVEDSNKIVTKKAKDLKKLSDGNKVTWKADGKDKEYTIDSSAKFYVNNKEVNAANFYKFISTTAGLNLAVDAKAKIGARLVSFDFINTDNNDDFEVVKATKYDVYTVQSVDAKAVYTKEGKTLYLQDKNSDANPVTYPKDLKKDDIIFVYADLAYGEVNTDAKDLKAEIKLCETKTDVLYAGSDDGDPIFGGTTYVLSDDKVGATFDEKNATGKYDITIDPIFGYVVKAEGSEAATEYFLVTAAENSPFSGNRIKGYNNDGKELTYKIKSGIDFKAKVFDKVFTNTGALGTNFSVIGSEVPTITRISVNKDGQVTEIKNAYTDITGATNLTNEKLVPSTAVLNKDSYKASSKLLTIKNISTAKDGNTYKVDSSSVFFFKDPLKDDYYAFVGEFPSIKANITDGIINYKNYEGDKVITSAYLVGKPSGGSSEFSNIVGYVISNDLRVNSDEDYYRVVKIMAKGEIKTYETETYTGSNDAAKESKKGIFVKFDLTTDGKIANDGATALDTDVSGYLFGDKTATDAKAMIAVSTSDTAIGYVAGNDSKAVATNYIKIDGNTKFMIADDDDADDSEIGTVGSIITKIVSGSTQVREGSNLLVAYEDEDATKVAKFVFIVRYPEKSSGGTGDLPPVATDGKVTYIDSTASTIDVSGKAYAVTGDAQTLLNKFRSQLTNAKIAFSTNSAGAIYRITAIDAANFNVNVAAMPISGITFGGNVEVSANTTASNVTVNGKLTVSGTATLAATNWHVLGTTDITSSGAVSFNSELDGDVTVASTATTVNFTNVQFGKNLAVAGGTVTVKNGSVAGNIAQTAGTVKLAEKLTVAGYVTGTVDLTGLDAANKKAIEDKQAAGVVATANEALAAHIAAGGKVGNADYIALQTALAATPQVTVTITSATTTLNNFTDVIKAAKEAQAAYLAAGGKTTDIVYVDVTSVLAVEPQVKATIIAKTTALTNATTALPKLAILDAELAKVPATLVLAGSTTADDANAKIAIEALIDNNKVTVAVNLSVVTLTLKADGTTTANKTITITNEAAAAAAAAAAAEKAVVDAELVKVVDITLAAGNAADQAAIAAAVAALVDLNKVVVTSVTQGTGNEFAVKLTAKGGTYNDTKTITVSSADVNAAKAALTNASLTMTDAAADPVVVNAPAAASGISYYITKATDTTVVTTGAGATAISVSIARSTGGSTVLELTITKGLITETATFTVTVPAGTDAATIALE